MDYGYSTTSYGAQGGASGGGFMPGSQGEGNSANAKRTYKADSLRPVTIKQLLEAHFPNPDSEHYIIDNSETTQVTFVGQVRNISSQTTNVTYKIDDGTGVIEAKVWVDASAEQEALEMEMQGVETKSVKKKPVEEGYARVFGRLKNFHNKLHVGAIVVRPVEDFNQVACHLLEATAVHLHFSRGPPESLQGQAESGANGASNGYAQQQNGFGGGDAGMPNMSAASRKIFACLRQTPQTNEGLHAQDIATRTGLELSEVMKGGDELMSLGKVYTTVDDLTWALLDI